MTQFNIGDKVTLAPTRSNGGPWSSNTNVQRYKRGAFGIVKSSHSNGTIFSVEFDDDDKAFARNYFANELVLVEKAPPVTPQEFILKAARDKLAEVTKNYEQANSEAEALEQRIEKLGDEYDLLDGKAAELEDLKLQWEAEVKRLEGPTFAVGDKVQYLKPLNLYGYGRVEGVNGDGTLTVYWSGSGALTRTSKHELKVVN